MTDADGHRIEAAEQLGFTFVSDSDERGADVYQCTEAQLLAFAKACERAGRAQALAIAESLYGEGPSYPFDNGGTSDGWNQGTQEIAKRLRERNAAADAELAPILEAERNR